jgi:hypothetical protein
MYINTLYSISNRFHDRAPGCYIQLLGLVNDKSADDRLGRKRLNAIFGEMQVNYVHTKTSTSTCTYSECEYIHIYAMYLIDDGLRPIKSCVPKFVIDKKLYFYIFKIYITAVPFGYGNEMLGGRKQTTFTIHIIYSGVPRST